MKKKSILVFLTLLIGVVILAFAINNVSTPKIENENDDNSSKVELVDSSSALIAAINNAPSDYETTTTISLTEDTVLNQSVTIKSGQIIEIVSETKPFSLGKTDLGYTLTISGKNTHIVLDRQAQLILSTNVKLNDESSIYAAEQHSSAPDFYASLEINDSLIIDGGNLYTDYFYDVTINGSLDLANGTVGHNNDIGIDATGLNVANVNINEDAALIQIGGSISTDLEGDGIYVYSDSITSGLATSSSIKSQNATVISNLSNLSDGSYILNPTMTSTIYGNSEYETSIYSFDLDNNLSITNNINIFPFQDMFINAIGHINVALGATFGFGGLIDGEKYYSAGSNTILFDGGANWQLYNDTPGYFDDDDGRVDFVDGEYDTSVQFNQQVNYGRSTYRGDKAINKTPLIGVNGASLNIFRGIVLQNNFNTQAKDKTNPFGGGIGIYDTSTLNYYGARVLYNANTHADDDLGGAGIGAYNKSTINMYSGEINYNSLCGKFGKKSGDGAGINLSGGSKLVMSGGTIGYNHGDDANNADGGGIIARHENVGGSSDIKITNGNIVGNFVKGYGGAICLWHSNVSITGGKVDGNRATFGGGIATSSNSQQVTVTLDKDEDGNLTEITNNTAYSNGTDTGYGGGVCVGNNNGDEFKRRQTVIVNDAYIANNTAIYGGGIANYSSAGSNNNKLKLNGGTIINNKAYNTTNGSLDLSHGYGIYSIKAIANDDDINHMVELSGGIRVDTSNNIVFASLNSGQTPIKVTGNLTTDGIVGLIRYANESDYNNGPNVVEFIDGVNDDLDKFLLDNANFKFAVKGKHLYITSVTENDTFARVDGETFSTLQAAINYITNSNINSATIEIMNNKAITSDDIISIPNGYNITIKGNSGIKTLSISPSFGASSTLFTIENGASLKLEDIIIDGNSSVSQGHLIIQNNGTFELSQKSKIINNKGQNGYASVIEVAYRAESITNIYGEISGSFGDSEYGIIYLGHSSAILNVYNGAIIDNSTAKTPISDIILEAGTITIGESNPNSNNLAIGTIIKQGNGQIIANNLNGMENNPIDISVNEVDYTNNRLIISVNDSNSANLANYSNYFNLINRHNQFDSLVYRGLSNGLVINKVLEIIVDFKDTWTLNGSNYQKGEYLTNGEINEDAFDSNKELNGENYNPNEEFDPDSVNLGGIAGNLSLKYPITYHNGALVFNIDSSSQLSLEKVTSIVSRSGYNILDYVIHNGTQETSSEYRSTSSSLDVSAFEGLDSIYLGVNWNALEYIFEFNNGGLTTANGNMGTQSIKYTNIESETLIANKYYATGFRFIGWKIVVSTTEAGQKSYLKLNGEDVILENETQFNRNTYLITDLQKENDGKTTFVLEAQWKSIFSGTNTIDNVGTSSTTAFKIESKEALEIFADTVNGINVDNYYNAVKDGNLIYKADDYLTEDGEIYYFSLEINITNFDKVIGNNDYDFTSGTEIDFNTIIADNDDKHPFSGNFNGNNHVIELNISGNDNFVGLFGYTKNATISNLTITGNISGNVSVGGLVGFAYGGNFDSIRNKANITYTGSNVGGIFGTYYLNNNDDSDGITGSIRNVYNEGNLSYGGTDGQKVKVDYAPTWSESKILFYYPGTRVGGIIGQSWDVSLTNAFNIGTIRAKYGVGGIIGTMLSSDKESRTNSIVTTAFNAGAVTATAGLGTKYLNYGDNVYQVNAYAGGIVGRIFGSATVNDAMNTNEATVSATWTGTYTENTNGVTFTYSEQNPTIGGRGVGGIIGVTSIDVNDAGGLEGGNKTISNVINTGKVSGWTHIGGIAGILAYSDLSYSINVANLEAKGTVSVGNGNHAFLGGLVGMGIAANLFSTAIFDGDITYRNYTDYTIQSIGDISANSSLGYDANNINSLKLSSSQIVCKPDNQKPSGLDSTFFESGWTWKTYDDDKYYYPQLVSFADTDGHNSTANVMLNGKTVAELSKTAISLKQEGQDVTEEYKVDITLNLGNAVKLIDQSGNPITDSIEITVKNKNNSLDTKTIKFIINSNPNGYVASIVAQDLSYIEYRDYIIDLSSIKASLNRIGYTFDDWYRDETFTEKFNNNLYLENNEIYVNWTTTEYQISYSNINAYVAGEVNLPTNYINIFTVNDNNFTLITNDDLKNGNDYIGNGAYDFVTWQYVIGTTPYYVDGFNIISDNGEYFVQLVNDGNPLSIDLIPIKNLEFRMYCTPYSYSIEYVLGDVSGGEQVTNNNRQTYTIEDEISFIEPEKTGYKFIGWYTKPTFEESSKITSIPRGTVGNRDKALTLYAKFEEAEQRLTFDLNGGTLTKTSITFNGNTYEIHYDNKDETNYILIKYKTPLIGFHDALIAIIQAPNNGTTASTITKTETGNQGTEVNDQDVMGPSNMRVYVNYTVTKYKITINPGQTNSQLSFANIDISNIEKNLEAYEIKEIKISDNIIITAEYGSNLQLLLEYLQKALQISGNYVFNGYSNNPNSLSIYNLRIDGEQDNISIQFLWTLENYHLEILDVYNQIIITINNSNSNNYDFVNNEGVLDIEKLKEYIYENHNTLEGYTFDNKFTNLQGGEIDTNYSLKGYSTLIAKYKNNEYDVSFNKNYSINDQNTFTEIDYQNKKLTYDKVVPQEILSLKPTRNGYDFIGWSYERNGQPLTSSQIYNLIPEDGSETLYAIWEEATYVIQYEFIYDDRWDNTTVDVSSLAKNYVFNSEEININQTLVQTGYKFIGWSLDGEDPLNSVIINTSVAESASNKVIVIYGHFEINKYTLKFDADGGKFNNNDGKINITVYYNERFNANLPEVPTKTGYEFIGYDNQSVLQSLAQDINNIEGIVVKAQWQPAIYTVNFFADGSGTWSEEVAYNDEVTPIDKAKIEANHPGYELVGWSNHPKNPYLAGVKITNDVTFTAIFEETTYDLNITLAGCTGFKDQVLKQLEELFGAYTPNSNGYTFKIKYNSSLLGLYNLKQVTDDNGKTHYFTSLSNNVATMPNQSLDLTITYSSVEVEKISVTIVIVNGPSNASDITYQIVKNESNIQIPNPQYVGYNFIGWKTNYDANITDINEYIKDNFSAKSITVKAEYEIQKDYSITYAADLNSNIWQTKTEVAYGTTIIEALGEPSSIPGYIFAGWYYGDQAANDLKVTENLNSIVAKWEETDYLLKFTNDGVSINSTIYQFGNEFIVPTLSETNDTYSFGVINYKYYLATYYIEDGSGTKHYLNDLFKSSANGNYIMGDLAEIAKQLGIDVYKENAVTYLTFILDPTAINYVINVENSDISVTFNVEDNNITINGTAPETKDFYEFAGIGITENNLLELNKSYHFSKLIALFSEDDLLNRRITLTSFETPITYTINGEKTFDVEDSYVDISDLTYGKEGYKFIGWLINEDDTYHYNSSIAVELLKELMLNSTDGTITLIPKYEEEKYLVHFNTEGGSFIPSQTVLYGDKINKPSDPSLEGYSFQYWSDVKNGSKFNFDTPVSNGLTLYAVWEARTYTITFSGEGTENIDSIDVSYDNDTKTFPNITLINGKKFLGYEYEGKLYNANDIIPNLIIDLNEDNKIITLTAKWVDKEYIINTYINGVLTYETKSYDEMIEKYMPTLPGAQKGYIYKGWYKDAEYNEPLTSIDFKEDVLVYNLYAEYREIGYTLEYNVGNSAQTIEPKQYDYFDEIILAEPTMNNGYIFKSWTYNDIEYELSSHPTGETFDVIDGATITLNIKYDTYYKVIFNANNGTSDSFELVKTTNEVLNIDKEFDYFGYDFIGWNENIDANEATFTDVLSTDLTTTPGEEVNVYAIWEVINYTIISEYPDLNIPTSINIESNKDINFNTYVPTKVGYTFSHYEDEYGNRIDDIDDVIKYAINNTINLKAIFNANKYIINYEYNNEYSTISVESQDVVYDELVTLATINITNNNYKFLYFEDKNGVKYYNGQTVSKLVSENSNSITLTAVYSFVITFEANGGSGTMPSIEGVVSNNAINVTLPANLFRRIGYTFAGWSTNINENSDSSNLLEQGTTYSSLATPLYAIWKANTYNITYMNNLGEILGSDTYSYDDSKELMSITEIQNNNPGYTISGWYNNSDCTGNIINEIEINSIGDKTYYLNYVAKDFKTTITINNVPIDKVSDFVNALNAKLKGCAKVSETSSSTVIVTITTKYNENRDSINELFKESYEYTISNVTYTLNSFKLNDDNLATPSEDDDDLTLEFVTSKIVVNLYYYTSIDKEAQSLGQFELKNDFVLIADMLNDRLVSITGYKGIGWKDSIDGADYSFGNTLTESISLYYYYEAIKFNISYDGASASKVTYGQVFVAGLDINGARFIGWSKEQNSLIATYKAGDKLDVLQANEDEIISLYSVYDYYELVVVLESNNGDNETLELKYSYDALTNLTSIPLSFSYIGHTFTKWTNKAGGSDLVVNSLANLIQNGDAEITLVANWSKNTYSIVYVGANITTSLSYKYGQGLDSLPSPEASENIGFTFSGWYDKANPSETDTEITSISNEEYGDKIYYANWTPNHYKIYFSVEVDTSGRDDILTDENGKQYLEVIYSEEIGALPNPKETHDFSGWRYDDGAISGGDIYRWAQDIIITPNNEGLTYNVVIDLAGGSLNGNNNVINVTASYNTAIETVLENAFGEYEVVKAGYKYDGYSVTDDATTITKDTVITIKWKLLTYTINYNYDNNKEIIVYDITKGDVSLLNPAKTGYTFNGWYQNNTFEGEQFIASNIDFVSLTDNEEIDLYAKFDPKNYHITFDLDGGLVNNSETISDLEVTYDANIPTLAKPSKLGYTFNGWYYGSTKITSNMAYSYAYDITVVARWSVNTYTITYDLGDANSSYKATNASGNITSYNVLMANINLLAPTREHYEFLYWTIDGNEVSEIDTSLAENITVTAVWKAKEYTIKYILLDEDIEPTTYTVETNNITLLNVDNKDKDYAFKGWYLNSDLSGDAVTEILPSSAKDYILYAKLEFTITINYNCEGVANGTINVIYNNAIEGLPTTSSVNGKKLIGFVYNNSEVNNGDIYLYDTNITIIAKYEDYKVTIEYDANGAAGNIGSQTIDYSNIDSLNLPSTGLTYRGHDFGGWSYDNININYQNNNFDVNELNTFKEYLKTLIVNSNSNISIKAIWNAKTYNITYNNVENATNNNPTSYTYSLDTIVTIERPIKTGYNFIGWTINNDTNKMLDYVIAVDTIGDITLTANFELINYQINYEGIEGITNTNPATYNIEEEVIVNPINKFGYTFLGWTKDDEEPKETYKIVKGTTGDITLTANWQANTYSITFNYNDESNKSNTITVLYDQYSGQLADEISKLYKYGYEFTNWTFNEDIITTIAEIAEYATYNEENKQYEITLDAKYNLKSDVKIVLNVKDVLSEKSANIVSEINNNLKGYNFTIVEESNDSNIVNIVVTIIGTYQTELELLNLIDINKEYEVNGITYKLGSYDYRYEDSNISSETYPYNYDEIPGEDVIVDVRYITNKILVYLNIDGETHKELEPTINEDGTYTLTGNEEELKLTPPTGYVWDGKWYSDSSYVTEYKFGKTETEVIELHAKYEPISYNIKFNANEGTLNDSETKSFTYDVEVKLDVNNPTKVGYTFIGWSYNGKIYTKDSIVNNLTSIDNDTIEFVASWVANTYTIIFDANGGITSVPSKKFTYDNAETLDISDPKKDGYTFDGWSYNGKTYQSYSEIKNLATEGEITFVATWEAITYTVVYDNNGGNGSMAEQTFTYDKYEALNANTFTKTGYTFIGWNTNKEATTALYNDLEVVGNLASTKNEKIRLYAIWQANTYTITFNLNGGNVVNDIADINLNYGQTATLNVEEPTRTGYIFGGWSYNGNTYNNDDELSNLTDINNAIIEFVAIWNPITYQVQFVDGDNVATIDLTYDKYYQINITNPSKVGYNFTHWSDKDNKQYVFGDILFNLTETNGDTITLTANYEIINYNISYILNGSNISGSYDTTYNVEDENINLPTPTLAGYDFDGWYDESLNNEFNYIQGQITGDLILYAKFIPNEYKISFNTKDSYIEGQTFNDVMISYNSKFGDKLPIPKAEFGITFHYWYYLDGDDKVIVNNNTIYDFTNDLVLYAYTEVTNYNIVYETNGGVNSDKNITNLTAFDVADGKTINIYSPTKAGYTFVGWYLDSNFNGDKIDVIDTALIENNINNVIRLYAKYEVHKFNINFYNGDTTNLISSIEVSYGQKINPITTPQKEGYIFDNWYLDGISIYDFNSPVISDLNIIALYKITEVKLSANINGELVDVVVTSIDGKGLQADTRIIIELVTDSNIINSSNELLTEFGRISRLYNIKLVDANGNTIQPEGQVRIALTLPNEELKGNERFSIVNIKDDISGYTLFDSNSEDGTITFNTTHFSYYGIIITDKIVDWTWLWVLLGVVAFILLQFLIVLLIKNRRFRIRFISKGDVKIRELKYKKDEKVSLPKPQRLGYRFVGWYLDSEFKHPAHITTMPNENLILYARWQEDPLTIGLIVKNRKK